jgi:hypothetical protein
VRRRAFLALALGLTVAACSTAMPKATPTSSPTSPPASHAPTATPDAGSDLYFPIHTIGPTDAFPSALAQGTLRLENGCLFLKWPAGDEDLVFWPAWVELVGPPLTLADTQSGVRAEIGDDIVLGGGQFQLQATPAHVRGLLGGQLPPERCAREHYWLASGIEP